MSWSFLLVFFLVIVPLSNLIHESGHLIAAFMTKAQSFTLSIGQGQHIRTYHMGSLTISTHLMFFLGASSGYARLNPFTPLEKMWISACGPLMNALIVIIGSIVLKWTDIYFMQWPILFNAWLALMNLIPFKVREKKSDGYIVCSNLFRGNKTVK